MAKMGRPQIQIDKSDFEKLCVLQCTKADIANWFECSEDTIEKWCKRTYGETFTAVFAQKREKGKVSLRRMQWKSAEAGNVTMQIFLGKQYLGQKDQQGIEIAQSKEKFAEVLDVWEKKREEE
jgi:hypothetical protein